jgi:hypothetical protein
MTQSIPPARPANNNDRIPKNFISFSDLATGMGLDEDVLLQRLAKIFSKRDIPAAEGEPP